MPGLLRDLGLAGRASGYRSEDARIFSGAGRQIYSARRPYWHG
ncbi:hypothetical protein BVG79_p1000200 (plasmid) [Ketogulonicigenium robustum]|uniref:Uncharacterized protein n=1 Tax=Ketogulonicigenium robustum TaxID=92947 RepID=A0A1W6P3C5_9RHOB|nr:hypothetical protein BVG79_p1000200 [Ketogulonicigenium robustum]